MSEHELICLMTTMFVHDLEEFPSQKTIDDAVESACQIENTVYKRLEAIRGRWLQAETGGSNDADDVPTTG